MLNLRCLYCQTPFTVGRAEMLTALITMEEKHQNHHDAHCPRCRRANSISRQRMELFFPNWREAAKQAASKPVVDDELPAITSVKTTPLSKAAKAAAVKPAAAKTKAPAKAKSAGAKPSTTKKTTPSSPSKTSKTPKTSSKSSKKK